jgi:hypothetical protein
MGLKLGDISPLAGIVTGEGMFGGLQTGGGLIPSLLMNNDNTEEKKALKAIEQQKIAKETKAGDAPKMKKGGSVSSASSRGDGCAQRGKTRGRMV